MTGEGAQRVLYRLLYNGKMHDEWRAASAAFRFLLASTLAVCALSLACLTIHWPLLGDASLIHYAVFLMDRGQAPYRDILEINMPGSYFVEWTAVHLFGDGQLAWRIFDLLLGASAVVAMVAITSPIDWFAGFWAGSLFLLIHGRDGILELGQREVAISTCLLAGYALLFVSKRRGLPWLTIFFGLLAGLAATIKPTMLLVGPASLLLLWIESRRREASPLRTQGYRSIFWGAAGWLLPLISAAVLLWREHAAGAFLAMTRGMLLYHAALARRSIGYLLLHSASPLLPLLAVWLLILVLLRRPPTWVTAHLWIGLGFGLFSYLSQGKGYSYQRYPVLAFLLLLMSLDFTATSSAWERRPLRLLGFAALAFGGFFLAPASTAMASHYDGKDLGTVGMIEKDLESLPPGATTGGVQCVDSIAGCTNALYRLKLVERSSVFYDEFLFGPASEPAVEQNREKFWRDIQQSPPSVIVVTAPLFPSGPDNYEKLSLWPQFDSYLKERYTLYAQRTPSRAVRWWSRSEIPPGYRIYLRKGG
jgi:hypothetical protein